jgi:hypothetical protein
MGMPANKEARDYRRVALNREDEAIALLAGDYTTAAVYLGGYSVECILKSLLLSVCPKRKYEQVLKSFRGTQGHDLDWLKRQYIKMGGAPIPKDILKALVSVNSWSSELRYKPGTIRRRDAEQFVTAARAIVAWANGRM